MKALILALTITASFNVMAAKIIQAPFATTAATTMGLGTTSSGADCMLGLSKCKEAVQILDESQEYFQNGNMPLFLSQKVKQLQIENESLSDEQAVDELISISLEILK